PPLRVVAVGAPAATAPYPNSCIGLSFCGWSPGDAGLVWLTRADARSVSDARSLGYVSYLKLADPAAAAAFAPERNPPRDAPPVTRPSASALPTPILQSWQDIKQQSPHLAPSQRRPLLTLPPLFGLP